ncbi:hypothetical protein C453_06601 [Haloferax elongans ATCC BAA-1513]|uniref:DUF7984 domain-containing protein n=1 Tax=Haloferax elongans ATCC BAA-1513 TaxID=1230453 RepID=M0HPQ3_HALEO|nr:hypothetical protein [Haloferax elongans]ELZ86550.1 hypothetical protein C453_06601 [Haloferax elongans ATCC BAA-1513]
MELTPAAVADEHQWVRDRAGVIVPLINETRDKLGDLFDTDVGVVDEAAYLAAVDDVFARGDVAVNVAAYVRILRTLDVEDDYPGFVVDEVLGRRLAATIAGGDPLGLLAEATFHFADVAVHTDGVAGEDDLDAALAAGFQTQLPGWSWQEGDSPFESRL